MSTVATTRHVYRDESLLQSLEVQAIFRGQIIGTRLLDQPDGAAQKARPAQYVIGAAAGVDAPVGQEVIGGA